MANLFMSYTTIQTKQHSSNTIQLQLKCFPLTKIVSFFQLINFCARQILSPKAQISFVQGYYFLIQHKMQSCYVSRHHQLLLRETSDKSRTIAALLHHHKGELVLQRCVYTKCLKAFTSLPLINISTPYIRHRLVVFVLRYTYMEVSESLRESLSHQQYFTFHNNKRHSNIHFKFQDLDYSCSWKIMSPCHKSLINSFKQSALRHSISEPHLPV